MICLIDGDVIAYIAAYGNEEEEAQVSLDKLVVDIMDSVFASGTKIAVKGIGNFRNDMYDEYKGTRASDDEYRAYIDRLRKYLVDHHEGEEAHGQEADDLLAQWAQECMDAGEEYAIASIDKDLLTIPGVHFNIRKNIVSHVDDDEADYLLNRQLLMGDSADNIPGLPGIGAKRAEKILEGVAYGKRREAVKNAYKEIYGSTWESELQFTGDLIWIRRIKDERFKI
jgi:5'-3' exonuclease